MPVLVTASAPAAAMVVVVDAVAVGCTPPSLSVPTVVALFAIDPASTSVCVSA